MGPWTVGCLEAALLIGYLCNVVIFLYCTLFYRNTSGNVKNRNDQMTGLASNTFLLTTTMTIAIPGRTVRNTGRKTRCVSKERRREATRGQLQERWVFLTRFKSYSAACRLSHDGLFIHAISVVRSGNRMFPLGKPIN